MAQGKDGWPGRITPEGTTEIGTRVGGRTQPSHFFPASLSSPILAVLLTVGVTLPALRSQVCCGGPSPCRVAGSWSCRSRPCTPWLSLTQCPSTSVLSRACTVSSVGGIVVVGFLLSHPFSPWALPRAEVRRIGLRALAGAAFSICSFLGNQGRCRCPYDVAGK